MFRKAILALAMFSSAGLAQVPISYADDFRDHHRVVDVTKGFYVCQEDNPRNVMDRLIQIPNDRARRNLAQSLGCTFILRMNNPSISPVIGVTADLCLDRHRIDNVILCGREGHQIKIAFGGVTQTIIWLSLDQDFD